MRHRSQPSVGLPTPPAQPKTDAALQATKKLSVVQFGGCPNDTMACGLLKSLNGGDDDGSNGSVELCWQNVQTSSWTVGQLHLHAECAAVDVATAAGADASGVHTFKMNFYCKVSSISYRFRVL